MAKKYEHTTEDAQMAKEPEAAYAMQDNCVHQMNVDIQDNEDMTIPPLQYSMEELNERISAGIEQYHKNEYYTQNEAHTLFVSLISQA